MLAHLSAIQKTLLVGLTRLLLVGALPPLPVDAPLLVDSTWKGKLTQMGKQPEASLPPEVQATLIVTKRDGDNVEIELREVTEGLDITFLCRGRIARSADSSLSLEFKSYGVKA